MSHSLSASDSGDAPVFADSEAIVLEEDSDSAQASAPTSSEEAPAPRARLRPAAPAEVPDSGSASVALAEDSEDSEVEPKKPRGKVRNPSGRPSLADVTPQEIADGWVRSKMILSLDKPARKRETPELGSININDPKVTVEQIDAVPWVGPPLARALVAGRPYPDLETVMDVRGMSPKLYEKIKVYIVFPEPSGRKAPPKDAKLPL